MGIIQVSDWTPLSVGILITTTIGAISGAVATIIGALNRTDVKSTRKTTEATHILTNSAMGEQLLSSIADKLALSVILHANAAKSGLQADMDAAMAMDVRVKAAEVKYQQHMQNQAVVDARNTVIP